MWQSAILASEKGSYNRAATLYSMLLEWQPRNAAAYLELGRCYIALDCRVAARQCFERAVQFAGSNTTLRATATAELRTAPGISTPASS